MIHRFIIINTFFLFIGTLILTAEELPSRVRVVRASDSQAIVLLAPQPERIRKLLETAIQQYTHTKNPGAAWKKIILPTDRVGIKIHTSPGPIMSTRQIVLETIIDGLEMAGLKRSQIIVFDQYASQMEYAGYSIGQRTDGVTVTATVPMTGYDPNASLDIPIPGKLIWGDLEFKKGIPEEEDQISTKSYLSRILTQQIDKMINLSVPIADPDLGIYGCRMASSLSLIDNFRRFHRQNTAHEDDLLQIFSNEIIQKKCVLHILDGLIAQYAAGPAFDPSYCWPLQSIYISRDPIAIDTLILQEINHQRVKAEVAPLKDEVAYLKTAADAGLGITDLSKMDVLNVQMNY